MNRAIAGNPARATTRFRMYDSFLASLLAERMLTVLAIHQLFHELYTLKLQKLCVLFLAFIKRDADLPRASEGVGIFNGGLVMDHFRTDTCVALDDVQSVAMKIPGAIEPGRIVHTGDVYHQGIAFPVTDGLAHPGIDRCWTRIFHEYVPDRAGILVSNEKLLRVLKNLERLRHVGCARDAGELALDLGVALQPMFLVLFLLRQRLGLVRNLATLDHAKAGRNRTNRSQRQHRCRRNRAIGSLTEGHRGPGGMAFEVVVGLVHDLPNSVQIRMTVDTRGLISLCGQRDSGGSEQTAREEDSSQG